LKWRKSGACWLIVASLYFYGSWSYWFVALLLFSMAVNFGIGRFIWERTGLGKGKRVLMAGIAFNGGLLIFFKYHNFVMGSCASILSPSLELGKIIFPIGISFYTFVQIAFLVDTFRRKTNKVTFLDYALFVSFFPKLIAGPIVRYKEMMSQFKGAASGLVNYENISKGLFLFSVGLFKKTAIADTLSLWVNACYGSPETLDCLSAWITSLSYTFQIYFDFSGYTDMALGIAYVFNIRLPINFNSPYKAINIQEFWRRWHITLMHFLRDYIYIPLGGNRFGSLKTIRNILITFFIGGIWHGAGWTFAVWGLLHGMAAVVLRIWRGFDIRMPKILAWFLVFNFVNMAWVFFRAKDLGQALAILKSMFLGPIPSRENLLAFFSSQSGLLAIDGGAIAKSKFAMGVTEIALLIIGSFLLVLLGRNSMEMVSCFRPTLVRALAVSSLLFFGMISLFKEKVVGFIYFQF
jgi:alginate O-acetyltransferase complex protein AlgI